MSTKNFDLDRVAQKLKLSEFLTKEDCIKQRAEDEYKSLFAFFHEQMIHMLTKDSIILSIEYPQSPSIKNKIDFVSKHKYKFPEYEYEYNGPRVIQTIIEDVCEWFNKGNRFRLVVKTIEMCSSKRIEFDILKN